MSVVSYKETDKMCEIITIQPSLLQMMCRFGIPLGVGEKTVREVCEAAEVNTETFLAVANYMKMGSAIPSYFIDKVSVSSLMAYLKQSHSYFLEFQLPFIRRKLIEAVDCSRQNEVAYLILKFYDEYMGEVRKHMEQENRKIFTYVDMLLNGKRANDFHIAQYAKKHEGMDRKLQELKNIIIKYYTPTGSADLLNNVLFSIFNLEEDMRMHCEVEDVLFVPAVQRLEEKVAANSATDMEKELQTQQETLSEREREIVGYIVRGMTNKEVASKLFISINTVLTHRKNISRKLDIHSISGLTIYAIVNGIVNLDEVKSL